jgi:hypothetical protein
MELVCCSAHGGYWGSNPVHFIYSEDAVDLDLGNLADAFIQSDLQ